MWNEAATYIMYPLSPLAMALSDVAVGSGPILLNNVSCDQSHSMLSQCVHPKEIGLHPCTSRRAGVRCDETLYSSSMPPTESTNPPEHSSTNTTAVCAHTLTDVLMQLPTCTCMLYFYFLQVNNDLSLILGTVGALLAVGAIAICVMVVVIVVVKRKNTGGRYIIIYRLFRSTIT